ncbi:MAG: polysaccharide biosynthesis/export family protein [Acidobacteriota bacterium]
MSKLRIVHALFLFVLTIAVPAAAQVSNGQAVAPVSTPQATKVPDATAQNDRYRIGFQDVLDIQIFRHPDLNQRVPVNPNGTIVLFRLEHPVVAICKTERELSTDIANAYKEKYLRDPEVSVNVAEQKSQSIAVIGSVEKPGNFFVNRRYHLLEMLALAGGPNKEAGTRLMIARTGSTSNCKENLDSSDNDKIEVVGFKIRDVQEGKQTFWMQPGDVVSVLPADIVYVYGNVNKQGPVSIREAITLTQAIVSAEGLKPAANKDKIRILRQKTGSIDREELVFDLNLIDKGKVKDPYLEPNDIVAVSQDSSKAVFLGVTNMIKSTIPSAIYRIP